MVVLIPTKPHWSMSTAFVLISDHCVLWRGGYGAGPDGGGGTRTQLMTAFVTIGVDSGGGCGAGPDAGGGIYKNTMVPVNSICPHQ